MMISISILILFITPIIILIVERFELRAGYLWLLAMVGAATAWLLILFSRSQAPLLISLMQWKPEALFSASPTLLLDDISWIFAAALSVFPLAVLLTDVVHFADVDPSGWAATLAMTGLGLLAVFAENPITLVLAWAVMDLSETLMLLLRVSTSEQRERVVVALSVRLIGILLIVIATQQARSIGDTLAFNSIPPEVSGLLLLAAGLRLGVLPPHQPFFQEPPLRRGLGTIVRLMPVASSLVILARIAQVGVPLTWQPYLLAVAVISALYGAYAWVQSPNELDGRPFWILGMAAIALVSTIFRLPTATIAWGLALLMSGSVLFLTSNRTRFVSLLSFVGILGASAFPFTPAWAGGLLYSNSGVILMFVIIIAHALLVLGYVRHVLQPSRSLEDVEPWMLIVYPIGLILLMATHWGIAWSQGLANPPGDLVLSFGWWGGVIAFGVVAILMIFRRREISLPSSVSTSLGSILSPEWIYKILWWLFRNLSRTFSAISQILEGEGGILWSILMLILLISLVAQQSVGG
ncbi:MAG: hypothetical protein ISR58_12645 [Anaerolineales bacterium]|nr:hypothetical protein [Chloroflexota bacterium]MBL6982027.1 hypothetical protein [Anaerolineales bacterium]